MIAVSARMYSVHRPQCRAARYFGYLASSRRNSWRVWCGSDVAVVAPRRTDRVCRTDSQPSHRYCACDVMPFERVSKASRLTDCRESGEQHHK